MRSKGVRSQSAIDSWFWYDRIQHSRFHFLPGRFLWATRGACQAAGDHWDICAAQRGVEKRHMKEDAHRRSLVIYSFQKKIWTQPLRTRRCGIVPHARATIRRPRGTMPLPTTENPILYLKIYIMQPHARRRRRLQDCVYVERSRGPCN
jgi:hypothetical protein